MTRSVRPGERVLVHAVMLLLVAVYLLPLGFVLSTSLRTPANVSDPSQWIPDPLTFENYSNFLESFPGIGRYAWNTVFIAVLSTAGTLASSSLAGYALARFRFPGSRVLLVTLLLTLMIPPQVTLIPVFAMFQDLGLINTPWPIIIPMLFGTPFVTFFFRQYFLTLPREYDEAARVDGASWLQVFFRIVVPLSKPAFATMGLLTLIQQWNSYFYPSVFLQREDQWVLTQAIVSLIGQYTSEQGQLMAGIILMSLPMVLLYVIGQRYVIRGIATGGIKG